MKIAIYKIKNFCKKEKNDIPEYGILKMIRFKNFYLLLNKLILRKMYLKINKINLTS